MYAKLSPLQLVKVISEAREEVPEDISQFANIEVRDKACKKLKYLQGRLNDSIGAALSDVVNSILENIVNDAREKAQQLLKRSEDIYFTYIEENIEESALTNTTKKILKEQMNEEDYEHIFVILAGGLMNLRRGI